MNNEVFRIHNCLQNWQRQTEQRNSPACSLAGQDFQREGSWKTTGQCFHQTAKCIADTLTLSIELVVSNSATSKYISQASKTNAHACIHTFRV